MDLRLSRGYFIWYRHLHLHNFNSISICANDTSTYVRSRWTRIRHIYAERIGQSGIMSNPRSIDATCDPIVCYPIWCIWWTRTVPFAMVGRAPIRFTAPHRKTT